jgi:uncharacterized protein YjeT (DUF2065 family)
LRPLPQATRLAARIIGPLFLAGGALLITQSSRMVGVIDAILENEGMFLSAAFASLAVGLAILALHPFWRGATSAFISGLGVLAVLRGLLVLFLPDLARRLAIMLLTTQHLLPIAGCIIALAGLWLLVMSFLSPPAEDLGLL